MVNKSEMHYDIIIVGGGMVGLTLAGALARAQANGGLKIAVIEAHEPAAILSGAEYGLRVSAISRASQQVFTHLGAWADMQAHRISPYEHMQVWDATGDGQIHFAAADLGVDVLGHIIENNGGGYVKRHAPACRHRPRVCLVAQVVVAG